MALNNLGLGFTVYATNQATPVFAKVTASMRGMYRQGREAQASMANGAASMAASFGLIRVGLAGVAGIRNVVAEAREFELGMAKVAAISDIATDSAEAFMLEQAALSASMKTQFSPKEAAEGLQQFAGAGFNAQQQAQSLVPALRLAQAGMISVEESSRSMTAAMKVFGIQADEAGMVTDKLLKIANVTDLQASDLALALGTVGRGASAAKQNLDEMLISMGLVRNTGVQASVAASSVSSALIFMANKAEGFKSIGVSVTNADGTFRDFIDVVMDTDKALAGVGDAAERTALASDLFGKFGLTAFQAVSTQINNGMTTAEGKLVKGAEAVAYLREQMKGAEGTAAEFEEKILGTFEGQQKLLQGIGQNLKVALGKPFIELMKPMIKLLLPLAERFVAFVNALPPRFKQVLAGIAVGIVGLTIALGGLLAVAGAIKFFGVVFAGSLGAIAPLVGVLLAIVAAGVAAYGAVKLFRMAAERDLGGVGKFFTDLWAKIKLFARAIGQLLSKGFVEGDVLDSLLTEEMAGLRRFIGGLVRVFTRIKAFFTGLRVGFKEFVSAAKPVWDNFKASLEDVLFVARKLFDTIGKGSKGPVAESMASGSRLGRFIGKIVTVIVDYAGVVMRYWSGFVYGIMSAVEYFRPVFNWVSEAFGELVDAVKVLFGQLGLLNAEGSFNSEVWGELGYAIGWVVTAAIQPMLVAMRVAVKVVTWVVRAIGAVISWVREKWLEFKTDLDKLQAIEDRWIARLTKFSAKFKSIWQGIVDFVKGIFDDLKSALNGALDFIAEVADRIPQRFRPEFLDEFITTRQQGTGEGGSIGGRAAELVSASSARGAGTEAAASATGLVGSLVARGAQRSSSEQARAAEQSGLLTKIAEAAAKPAVAATPTLRLYIDGRELATRVESGQRKNSALAFEGGT